MHQKELTVQKIYIDTPHMNENTYWKGCLGDVTDSTQSGPSNGGKNELANGPEATELWSAFHRITWPYMSVNICLGCSLSDTNTAVSPLSLYVK